MKARTTRTRELEVIVCIVVFGLCCVARGIMICSLIRNNHDYNNTYESMQCIIGDEREDVRSLATQALHEHCAYLLKSSAKLDSAILTLMVNKTPHAHA